jgi:hypothetical protein
MTTRERDKIAAGLREAIAVARGEEEPARIHKPQEIESRRFERRRECRRRRSPNFTDLRRADEQEGLRRPRGRSLPSREPVWHDHRPQADGDSEVGHHEQADRAKKGRRLGAVVDRPPFPVGDKRGQGGPAPKSRYGATRTSARRSPASGMACTGSPPQSRPERQRATQRRGARAQF